jgi:hypothetical protein
MSKKIKRPLSRYTKINALLRRKLIRPALFSNEMIGQHQLRAGRRNSEMGMPKPFGDVETPEDCWNRAGERIRKMDPERRRARKVFHALMTT